METVSSNFRERGSILVSIRDLFSSSSPTASLLHPDIARITCFYQESNQENEQRKELKRQKSLILIYQSILMAMTVCVYVCVLIYLTRKLWTQMAMAIERGSNVEACRVVVLHAWYASFKDLADFPKLGTLIHVLIKPFFTNRQVEFLNQKGQLTVGGSQKGQDSLEELKRQEVVRQIHAFKIIDPSSQEIVEAIDRVCRGRIHHTEKEVWK